MITDHKSSKGWEVKKNVLKQTFPRQHLSSIDQNKNQKYIIREHNISYLNYISVNTFKYYINLNEYYGKINK